jgi:hypothetical protein
MRDGDNLNLVGEFAVDDEIRISLQQPFAAAMHERAKPFGIALNCGDRGIELRHGRFGGANASLGIPAIGLARFVERSGINLDGIDGRARDL